MFDKLKMPGRHLQTDDSYDEINSSSWATLYRCGGVAAAIVATIFLVEFVGLVIWRPPSTAIGYFTLFQSNWLLGLFDFYIMDMVAYVFFIPVFLALYISLRRANQSWMLISTALVLVGIAVYLISNTAFGMLSLSSQYFSATTDAQRAIILAAGESMFTLFNVTGLYVSYVLFSIPGLIISVVMVRSNIFSKATGYAGIVANSAALVSIVLAFQQVISGLFMATSFVLLEVWLILVARKLLTLK